MSERRHGYDPDYTGPERRNRAQRIKVLEKSKILTDQSADEAEDAEKRNSPVIHGGGGAGSDDPPVKK